MTEDLIFGTIAALDSDLAGKIFGAITAVALAFNGFMTWRVQVLTLASKKVSEGNSAAIAEVVKLGQGNADAIEHTRVQNVNIRSAVEDTKTQNDELATAVNHVHICVETKAAELATAVKEVVPAAIKEVVPEAIAALKE